MSKVSFRTRQIDFNRSLPIVRYDSELFVELGEGAFVNRGAPTVPSGMEREEENVIHFETYRFSINECLYLIVVLRLIILVLGLVIRWNSRCRYTAIFALEVLFMYVGVHVV